MSVSVSPAGNIAASRFHRWPAVLAGADVWLAAKASAGDAGMCKPKSAMSCGSAMRVLVFFGASTVPPAACRLGLLSVWSNASGVDHVFSGACPAHRAFLSTSARRQKKRVDHDFAIGPVNTTTFPPGPEQQRELFPPAVAAGSGQRPSAPAWPPDGRLERLPPAAAAEHPALRRLVVNSLGQQGASRNAAELRKFRARVLCFSKNFGLIFFRLSNVNTCLTFQKVKQQSVADIFRHCFQVTQRNTSLFKGALTQPVSIAISRADRSPPANCLPSPQGLDERQKRYSSYRPAYKLGRNIQPPARIFLPGFAPI